jgi:hypothetical protein
MLANIRHGSLNLLSHLPTRRSIIMNLKQQFCCSLCTMRSLDYLKVRMGFQVLKYGEKRMCAYDRYHSSTVSTKVPHTVHHTILHHFINLRLTVFIEARKVVCPPSECNYEHTKIKSILVSLTFN